jgi:hypothetical protein
MAQPDVPALFRKTRGTMYPLGFFTRHVLDIELNRIDCYLQILRIFP